MQLTEQQAMMQQQAQAQAQQQFQQQVQLDLQIMNIKMALLSLAKDIRKENPNVHHDELELYYFLREEVLGIPQLVKEEPQPEQQK